jgi:hypothetical protein
VTWHQQHFIQSRFNLHLALQSKVCPTEESYLEWCARRAELFLDITLPSMLAQSSQAFEWLIYFDVERNPPVERVLAALAPHANIHPMFFDCRGRHPWELVGHARIGVAERTSPGTEVVLTTKLDTDDALHRDYVRVLNHRARQLGREEIGDGLAVNCDYGVQLVGGRLLAYLYGANPFLTMVEYVRTPTGDALNFDLLQTAMTILHYKVHESFPVDHFLYRQPLWLQTIHEANAFNEEIAGLLELAEPAAVGELFGITPAAFARTRRAQTVL